MAKETPIVHTKTIKMPELEACLGQPVKIVRSTPGGEEVLEARIAEMGIPWQMYIEFDEGGKTGQFIAFAGGRAGIVRIERDGEIIYENKKIPVPYPGYSMTSDIGIKSLNDLRRECFGEGYDYPKLSIII